MKLTRPEPLLFDRYDGSTVIAPPITRGQMREVLAIDRAAEEGAVPPAAGDRRGEQVAIFLRGAKWAIVKNGKVVKEQGSIEALLEDLTIEEEILIIHAFMAQHHGYSVQTATDLQKARFEIKKKAFVRNRRRKS